MQGEGVWGCVGWGVCGGCGCVVGCVWGVCVGGGGEYTCTCSYRFTALYMYRLKVNTERSETLQLAMCTHKHTRHVHQR